MNIPILTSNFVIILINISIKKMKMLMSLYGTNKFLINKENKIICRTKVLLSNKVNSKNNIIPD